MTTIKVFDGAIWQTTSLPISSGGGGDVHVGPDAPPGTPDSGDIWFDTDDPGYIPLPLAINSGGTQASSAFSARANLAVPGIGNSTTTAGAPTTGTWARGDEWLDSANVRWTCITAGTPGTWASPREQLAYNQITAGVSVNSATPVEVIPGTARTYDGSPVIVEFYTTLLQGPQTANQGIQVYLFDGATDLGGIAEAYGGATGGNVGSPVFVQRRITPTPGSHTYRIAVIVPGGQSGWVWAGVGGASSRWSPAYIRVTRP